MTMDTNGNEGLPAPSVEDQLNAVTALLGAVLLTVGEPVHVPKEVLATGWPTGRIAVDNHEETNEYVLYVEVEDDDSNG